MPPVFGPVSPSKTALWSCVGSSGSDVAAVAEGDEADLFAREELLDHQRGPLQRWRGAALGFGAVVRDDHAFAGGEAVGLEHHREAEAVERAARPRRGCSAIA